MTSPVEQRVTDLESTVFQMQQRVVGPIANIETGMDVLHRQIGTLSQDLRRIDAEQKQTNALAHQIIGLFAEQQAEIEGLGGRLGRIESLLTAIARHAGVDLPTEGL